MRAVPIVLPALVGAYLALAAPAARAQGTGGTSGSTGNELGLTKDDFDITLWRQDGDERVPLIKTDLETFFNRARCECKSPIRIRVQAKAGPGRNKLNQTRTATVKVRLGEQPDCMGVGSDRDRGTACFDPSGPGKWTTTQLSDLLNGFEIVTTANVLFGRNRGADAEDTATVCNQESRQQHLWLWVDADKNDDPDMTDAKLDLTIDGDAPPAPTGLVARGGQEAIEVTWDSLGNVAGHQGYIVFCSRGDNIPVFKAGTFSPAYSSTGKECPTTAAGLTTQALFADDIPLQGLLGSAPPPFRRLEPAFACSDVLPATATSHRVKILQNGIPYLVGVAALDKNGNASPIDEVALQIPVPTRDFYRGYREAGGRAEGGYCALATRPGGRGRVAFAIVVGAPLLVLAARGWRRRRARRP